VKSLHRANWLGCRWASQDAYRAGVAIVKSATVMTIKAI